MDKSATFLKMVIVGDEGVGKTALVRRFVYGEFPEEHLSTTFDNFIKETSINNQTVHLSIWDTASSEERAGLRLLSYSHCDVALVCFSIDDQDSWINANKKWMKELDAELPEIPKIMVATKADLFALNPEPSTQCFFDDTKPIRKTTCFRKKNNYLKCSGLTSQGISEIFEEAISQALHKKNAINKIPSGQGSTCNCTIF